MHLYEIAQDYQGVLSLMESADLSNPDEAEAIGNALAQVGDEFRDKATNLVRYVTNIGSDVEALDAEIARLTARKKAIAARREWCIAYLLANMQATGITEIKQPAFTIRLRDNPVSVIVDDPALIPAEFMRQPEPPPPSPDKKAIGEAIKAGRDVPGCHTERKQRVEIK